MGVSTGTVCPGCVYCPDACVANWNGCLVSSSGSLYSGLADAWTNCGWWLTYPNSDPGNPTVTGSAGTFDVTLGFNPADLRRHFEFDYRTRVSTSFETNVSIPIIGQIDILFGTGTSTSNGVVRVASDGTSLTITGGLNSVIKIGTSATISIVTTLKGIVSKTNKTVIYFDGASFASGSSCVDRLELEHVVEVDGAPAFTYTQTSPEFAGIRCYAWWGALIDANGTSATPIGISSTTILAA